jgi:two-component system CheB/CheR fusion protein
LVVDDHPGTIEALAILLRLMGHEPHTASSGAAAIAAARDVDPHLVLLDIALPDMSGYDVARELRRETRARRYFLAAATGYGRPCDLARAAEAGFDIHLTKPFELARLRAVLERSAARHNAG